MKFERKAKIADAYIKHRNYFYKGQSELTMPKNFIQVFVYADLLMLARFKYKAPIWIMLCVGLGLAIIFWALGWLWDRHKLYDRETEFGNKRNKFVGEMRNEINKRDVQKRNRGLQDSNKNSKRKRND